jgi:hypothetical protein
MVIKIRAAVPAALWLAAMIAASFIYAPFIEAASAWTKLASSRILPLTWVLCLWKG